MIYEIISNPSNKLGIGKVVLDEVEPCSFEELKELCELAEATRTDGSSGSTELPGCTATPAPSHIILYHDASEKTEWFWDESVVRARYELLKDDWDCGIYVKQ